MDAWSPHRIVDRLQVAELLYRYCRAIDRIDIDLLATLFHTDAIIDKGDTLVPVDNFVHQVAVRHPTVPRASHMVTNHLIDFTGPDSAFVESWCLAIEQHPAPDSPSLDRVYRVRYGDSFERREGEWRIAYRTFVVDHVMNLPADPALILDMGGRFEGRRGPDDAIECLRRNALASA